MRLPYIELEHFCYYLIAVHLPAVQAESCTCSAKYSEFRSYSEAIFRFTKKLDFIDIHLTQSRLFFSFFLLDFSHQRLRVSLYFLPPLIFSCTIVETEQICFAIYSTYCESGRSSVFIAAFSCLEMGPTEQRQYFTVAWQAAAKVFTASLQCGKMDPGRDAQAEAWVTLESAHLALPPLIIFTFYINSVFYFLKWKKEIEVMLCDTNSF